MSNEIERQVANLKQGQAKSKFFGILLKFLDLRNERKAFTVTVYGNVPFPAAPTEAAINDVDIRIKKEETHRLIMELFAERPMWTRAAISHITKLDENLLKFVFLRVALDDFFKFVNYIFFLMWFTLTFFRIILAKYAFYIVSGPWGRLWCRFGYDPRLDSSAKQYQTVMVSFRGHQNIPERNRLRVNLGNSASTSTPSKDYSTTIDYVYRPGSFLKLIKKK